MLWTQWITSLKDIPREASREADEAFVTHVESVQGQLDPITVWALMGTYNDYDDGGVQEVVKRVIASAEPEWLICALQSDLPRLLRVAPEEARTLVIRQLRSHAELFLELSKSQPPIVRMLLSALAKRFLAEGRTETGLAELASLQ